MSEISEDPLSYIRFPADAPFAIRTNPATGRYVVATRDIPKGTVLLHTEPPIMSVIMREYRKEVCAYCFHYNRGRNLPVRQTDMGKAFCCKTCLDRWTEESVEGLEASVVHAAWTATESFIQKSSKRMRPGTAPAGSESKTLRPDAEDVEHAFSQTRPAASAIRDDRDADAGLARRVKSKAKIRREAESSREVDPDILAQLLPGVLLRASGSAQKQNQWQSHLRLARTPTPYASALTLTLHCDALLQLLAILPHALLGAVTERTVRDTIAHEAHNSFGIRSLDDKGDEFLGYGVWPQASLFNHSCAPNVAKAREVGGGGDRVGDGHDGDALRPDGRVWTYWTVEDVNAGEELSITYLGGEEATLDLAERRERLDSTWGFECMCRKCVKEDSTRRELE